jgi:competence protein ComEC
LPLLWLSLAFLAGIVLGGFLGWSLVTWLILAALCTLILLGRLFLKRFTPDGIRLPFRIPIPSSPIPYSLMLLALCLGGFRYQLAQPDINEGFIAWYNDREVNYLVEGILDKPPDVRDTYTNLKIRVDQIHPPGELPFTPVDGLLLARVAPGGDWHYGDRVLLEGSLETPPEDEDFSYRRYLERQGVYSYMPRAQVQLMLPDQGNSVLSWIFRLKGRALETVYQIYPDPEASLLAGILLGVESGIPESVQQAFRDTGTSHIIVISGFNITIIAGLLATVFGRLLGHGRKGARWGALFALIGIVIYTILVGGDAAVVRAAIMGGFTLLAMQVGRRQDGLNSLALVAALMALHNPHVLWDVGFQLSFAATLGLVMFAEPFTGTFVKLVSRRMPSETALRLSGPVGEYLLFTLAATLLTLPVILYHFHRLSLTSLIANPLILPAQPPVMILGGLAVILGMIYQPLGQVAAYLAWPFVVYTIRVVELLSHIPGGAITIGRVSLLTVALFYAALLVWVFAGPRIREWLSARKIELPSRVWVFGIALLGVLTVVVWRAALSAPDGKLHMTVLDVGTGDAILIQTPTGRNLLIDGGPSSSKLSDSLGRRLPLTGRKLDYLVVGATEDEQLAALSSTIERFLPANVLWSGPTAGSRAARQLRERLVEMQIPVANAQPGHILDLGEGATLEVLAVTRRGAVYLLEWGEFSALLPIGLDFETMEALQDDRHLTQVTALLLADSGYAPVNTPGWVARWNPTVALLSVGAGDWRGLPDPQTLEAVQNYNLLRTDRNGWIHLSTDGKQLWVEVERK